MQVKCKSCGATQIIIQNNNCNFCGSLIELDEGKSEYNMFSQTVNGNFIILANSALDAHNWDEAITYFNKVLESDSLNCDAWLGKGLATFQVNHKPVLINVDSVNSSISYWNNALKFSNNAHYLNLRTSKMVIDSVILLLDKFDSKFQGSKVHEYASLISNFKILIPAIIFAKNIGPSNIDVYKQAVKICIRLIDRFQLVVVTNYKKQFDYLRETEERQINESKLVIKQFLSDCINELKGLDSNSILIIEAQSKLDNFLSEKEVRKGCFIATASMGDYNHPVVIDLRLFRDNWLLKRRWGLNFTNWYYKHGPKAANLIGRFLILQKLSFVFLIKPLHILIKKIK